MKCTRTTQARCKRYGVVFVCLTTHEVPLDLVGNLRTDNFLLALIRFMTRRGKAKTIWTDNGTIFIGTETEFPVLLKDLNETKIENSLIDKSTWKFNPPWMVLRSQLKNFQNNH